MKDLIFKKEKIALAINENIHFESDSQAEKELLEMIVSSSDEDKILFEKEFLDYVHKYENGINWWHGQINNEGIKNLEKENYIKAEYKKFFIFFKTKRYKATKKVNNLSTIL